VPAHVSVLYPFAPPSQIDEQMLGQLGKLVATVASFDYSLTRMGWFGEEVLWLAPDPAEPFRTLTRLLSEAFPTYPPYGGRFDKVIPHLTVADRGRCAEMRAAEQSLRGQLPLRSAARSVTLIVEDESGRWTRSAEFALGASH
jgi:hypothetical protein